MGEGSGQVEAWGKASTLRFLYLFGEKILVETLEFDGPADTDADVMLNHESGKTVPIDQDHALG
jgi:hypothetical protein